NFFFFSSRRRHTRLQGDWSSDVCSSDLALQFRDHGGRSVPPRRDGCRNTIVVVRHADAASHRILHDECSLVNEWRDASMPYATKIGRASCRERVYDGGVAIAVKRKQ